MAIEVGELHPMGIVVRDVDPARTPINAQLVTLEIRLPSGLALNPQIANPPGEAGFYLYDHLITEPGHHEFVWRTTQPTLVHVGSFDARDTRAPTLLSLAKAKHLAKIAPDDDEHDAELWETILATTGAVENETGEVVARRPVQQTRRLHRPTVRLALAHRPVHSLIRVVNLDTGAEWVPPAIEVDEHGILDVNTGSLMGRVRVEYVAGYAIIPPEKSEAAGYIFQHLWANKGGSSARPRVGGQAADEPSAMGYSIPNRARDLLGRAGPLVG